MYTPDGAYGFGRRYGRKYRTIKNALDAKYSRIPAHHFSYISYSSPGGTFAFMVLTSEACLLIYQKVPDSRCGGQTTTETSIP